MPYFNPSRDPPIDPVNSIYNNSLPVANISCTVVVKCGPCRSSAQVLPYQQVAATIHSTNFFAIATPRSYLVDRQDGTTSIMANSLICVLREHISQLTTQLRPLFRDSIFGCLPMGTVMSLATTRVPDFGDEMETPHTGYQELLANVGSPIMQYSGIVFDPNQEIMSMASISSYNSAKLADFTRMWYTLLQPARHFFLIFQIEPLPPSPHSNFGLLPSHRTIGSLTGQCPTLSTPSTSTDSLLTNTQEFSSTFPIYHLERPESLFEQQLQVAIGPSFTPQRIKDAVSLKDKPLFESYKNWLAMARFLEADVADLPGLIGEVGKTIFSTNDTEEILRYFNWAPTSYYKKRRLFLWAYSAASTSWHGPTGTSVHRTWKGIVHLWGKGGAFERNIKPDKRSDNPDEQYASKLTQDAIEKNKTDISRYLENR